MSGDHLLICFSINTINSTQSADYVFEMAYWQHTSAGLGKGCTNPILVKFSLLIELVHSLRTLFTYDARDSLTSHLTSHERLARQINDSFPRQVIPTSGSLLVDNCLITRQVIPSSGSRLADNCLITRQVIPSSGSLLADNCLITRQVIPSSGSLLADNNCLITKQASSSSGSLLTDNDCLITRQLVD